MLPQIRLDRGEGKPLHEQLTGQLRRLVLTGELAPGTRLPPTRRVAAELGVSRSLVVHAYEQLLLEGYLASRVGAGTWVAANLPAHLLRPEAAAGDGGGEGSRRAAALSSQGVVLASQWKGSLARGEAVPFAPGGIAAEHFPARVWARLSARVWRGGVERLVQYGEAAGYARLRRAIAEHLSAHRAVRCDAGQVLVTAGSQQAADLAARLLVDPGDAVAIEEPGYQGTKAVFAAAGGRLVPVPVDDQGLKLPGASRGIGAARVVYVTPSHQFPLGVTMTLDRRLRLLEWARRRDAWILEDDYDSEFRYEARPLPSLQGLDRDGRVLYVGTFSKVLAPGLRLGFLVLPPDLVDPFRRARLVMDQHPPLASQAILAAFLEEGHLERHIARLRGVYAERREALMDAIRSRFGDELAVRPGAAGIHVAAVFDVPRDDAACARRAAGRGLDVRPLSSYYIGPQHATGFVLGFGMAEPDRLRRAVAMLHDAVQAA